MGHPYYDIAFTPAVRAQQERDGSRAHYAAAGQQAGALHLGPAEVQFIEAADHFYQATVSETGWPYVQHRGGPAGFVQVLDERTIAFADFGGNRQFISVGNLQQNDRIALIIMDLVKRRRIKLMGRVRTSTDPALMRRLQSPDYPASVERAFVITLEGFDWNCPQHITQRYTRAAVDQAMAPLRQQIDQLRQALVGRELAAQAASGSGPLALTVSGMRQLSPRVRAYELSGMTALWQPGAHLEVAVRLADGSDVLRHYSLMPVAGRPDAAEIAVLDDGAGRGGAAAIHAHWQLGQRLHCAAPRNHFALHEDGRPALLLAGGIGITALRAMALALAAQKRPFTLHYAARSRDDAVYAVQLAQELGPRLRLAVTAEGNRLDVGAVLAAAPREAVVYVCGPARLLAAAEDAAAALGLAPPRSERFAAAAPRAGDRAVSVTLARSGKTVAVAPGTTILAALEQTGLTPMASCRTGDCGVCAVQCLDGSPDHRDQVLDEAAHQAGRICICVSRAHGDSLTLDL